VNAARMWDAILRGKEGGYNSDIKMAYIIQGNALNQALNSNRGAAALRQLDFIVVHDQFLTPTARFAISCCRRPPGASATISVCPGCSDTMPCL